MEKAKILDMLIRQQGYNPKSFASKCGMPYTTLYNILKKGVGKASVDNIIIICHNLGITVDQLEEMAKGEKTETESTSYNDVELLVARNGKNMTTEQRMRLIKLLSEID